MEAHPAAKSEPSNRKAKLRSPEERKGKDNEIGAGARKYRDKGHPRLKVSHLMEHTNNPLSPKT